LTYNKQLCRPMLLCYLFEYHFTSRHLPSFPTRRSSDLHRLADTKDRWHGRWYETLGIPYPRLGWLSVFEIEGEWTEARANMPTRSEEHTSELQSHLNLVCRLLLEKKKTTETDSCHANDD